MEISERIKPVMTYSATNTKQIKNTRKTDFKQNSWTEKRRQRVQDAHESRIKNIMDGEDIMSYIMF